MGNDGAYTTGPAGEAPRVSAVLAVHDGGEFVGAAIDSLLGQSYADLEVVVVDDGSTDDTARVLADRAAGDPRVRVATNGVNLGLARSLNVGIAVARGELIARMDADDLSPPDRIATQVAFLDAHPDVGIVGGAYEEFSIDPARRRPGRVPRSGLRGGAPPLPHGSIMVRRSAFDAVGTYDPRFSLAEDHDLFLRMHQAGVEMVRLDEVLLHRRKHPGSVSQLHRRRQLGQNLALNARAVTRQGLRLDRHGWLHVTETLAHWCYLTLRLDRLVPVTVVRRLLRRPGMEQGAKAS